MWEKIKTEILERLTFEALNGWFVYIPWGFGFLYYGIPSKELLSQYSILHERFGFNYAMVSVGIVLIVWGLRKATVNRVKQQLKFEKLAKKRKAMIQEKKDAGIS